MKKTERRFAILFTITLIICFSPLKSLAIFTPLIFIIGMIFYVGSSPINHLIKYGVFVLFFTAISLSYSLLIPDFEILNAWLWLLTASSPLIWLYDFRRLITVPLLHRLAAITTVFLIIESAIGILHGIIGFSRTGSFDLGNGDFVRGTIDPFLTRSPAGSSIMLAILLSTLLTFLLGVYPSRKSPSYYMAVTAGLLCWVLASAVHTLIFFTIAVVAALLLLFTARIARLSRERTNLTRIIMIIIAIGSLASVIHPKNFQTTSPYFQYTFGTFGPNAVSPKIRATYNTLVNVPQVVPLQPLIGLGPGQYSSRASLIRSGEYLEGRLPLPPLAHPLAEQYIISEWRFFKRSLMGGSVFFPFYSWLSVYGEFGLIGIIAVISFSMVVLLTLLRSSSQKFPYLRTAMIVLLIYIVVLGFQDVYWEMAQAIFPGMLILRLGFDYLRRCQQGIEHWTSALPSSRTAGLHVQELKSPIR